MDARSDLIAAQPLVRLRFTKEVLRVSVNATNTLAVLTGKKGLSVIGLTPPYAVARELIHPGKAAPANAVWAPLMSHASFIASHSGQAVHLWNLNDARSALQATLTHTRNVRSVAWSTFDASIIATCAADNAIHLWDLRDVKACKSIATFKVFTSGISQVRWNKLNPNILASAHDQQVEVWDIRKSAPMTFITAHPSKISSIDWSGFHEWHIVTAGMDGAVKLWDVKRSRICQGSVATGSPVVRAAFLPGDESVLVLNSDVAMRVYNSRMEPTHALMGTRDQCTDFALQPNGSVVAWSRDSHLCMWDLSRTLGGGGGGGGAQADGTGVLPTPSFSASSGAATGPDAFGGPRSPSAPPSVDYTQRRAPERQPSSTMSLRDEMDAVLADVSAGHTSLKVECDVARRSVVVDAGAVQLRVTFPSLYPHDASPSFEVLHTTLSTEVVVQLLASLSALAKRSTQASRPCLRALVVAVAVQLHGSASSTPTSGSSPGTMAAAQTRRQIRRPTFAQTEDQLPCPRMSGASFSPSGRLVVFTNCTPPLPSLRTASALQETLYAASRGAFAPTVTHYALPNLVPASAAVAARYALQPRGSGAMCVAQTCHTNAEAAMACGLPNVARAWATVGAVVSATAQLDPNHPLARPTVTALLSHFHAANDIQTVACLVRVLFVKAPRVDAAQRVFESKTAALPDLNARSRGSASERRGTITEAPVSGALAGHKKGWSIATDAIIELGAKARSSATAATAAATNALVAAPPFRARTMARVSIPTVAPAPAPAEPALQLLDPAQFWRYLSMIHAYADWCLCMGLYSHRADLLAPFGAALTPLGPAKKGLSFEPTCSACNRNVAGRSCAQCNRACFACAVCRLPVRGLTSLCNVCGHGGHFQHMLQWFRVNDECASGCGCQCRKQRGDAAVVEAALIDDQ